MIDFIGQLIRDFGLEKEEEKHVIGCIMLEYIAAIIISNLNKNSQNTAIRLKWTWLAQYFSDCTLQKIDEVKFQWNYNKLSVTCPENILKLAETLGKIDTEKQEI